MLWCGKQNEDLPLDYGNRENGVQLSMTYYYGKLVYIKNKLGGGGGEPHQIFGERVQYTIKKIGPNWI